MTACIEHQLYLPKLVRAKGDKLRQKLPGQAINLPCVTIKIEERTNCKPAALWKVRNHDLMQFLGNDQDLKVLILYMHIHHPRYVQPP